MTSIARHPRKYKPNIIATTFPDFSHLISACITAAVNELSPYKKISETVVVKAQLYYGQKIKPESVLKAVKEVIL